MPLFVFGQRNEWWHKKLDFSDNNQDKIDYLNDVAIRLYQSENYSLAIKAGKKTIKLSNKYFKKDNITPMYYSNLASYYSAKGNINKAERIGTEAVRLFEKYGNPNDPAYAICLHNLADCHNKLGHLEDAIDYISQSVKIYENIQNQSLRLDYYAALRDQTYYYGLFGNYVDAIKVGEKAMTFYKKYFDERNPDYLNLMLSIANYKRTLGNYYDAIRLFERALNLAYRTEEAFDHYLTALMLLGDCNYLIGNYEMAISQGLLMLAFEKLTQGTQSNDYLEALNSLSLYYNANNNRTEAMKLQKQALEILSKKRGKNTLKTYGIANNNMSGFYYENGEIDSAIMHAKKAEKLYRKIPSLDYSIYGQPLQNLSVYYYEVNKIRKSVRYAKRGTYYYSRFYGDNHPDYFLSIRNLAVLYFLIGKYDKACSLLYESYNKTSRYILTNFATITYNERSMLWTKYSDFFESTLPYVANEKNDDSLCAIAYNALLLSKGLTLNSEIEIHNLIENSNDTALQNSYRKIKNDLVKLDIICQQPPNKRKVDVNLLRNKITKDEIALVEKSKTLGDYTRNLSLNFKDIQNNLSDNDLAIEFANIKTQNSNRYLAFVLKKGMTTPKVVNLFEMADFKVISSNDYYTTSNLYNLIWKPLQPYLTNIKNVYFSPSGILHTIGIEYLHDNEGNVFSDKYNVFRLSSTRELALPKISNPNKKAATFGGIQYDNESTNNGNGVMYLVGTKKESEAVASLLRSADYEVFAQSDTAATEESFKNLSGQGIKILHISTHGFYQSEVDMASIGLGFLPNGALNKEDRSLDCSGLLFAGANAALDSVSRSAIPYGNDDGILTAKEISRLDFKGLDLVILSACQTGLGEVTGEGVFGLQRGFKKAGAQTIIMSLWDVDDYATRLLMVQFFKGLTEGLSKREAFQSAIDYVKSKNDDPKYWAAFVMVDGVE